MVEAAVGLLVFSCLSSAFLLVLRLHHRLPEQHRSDDTLSVVRVVTGVMATLSALVLSLVISTVESSFTKAARDVRIFAGELSLLDGTLRAYGPGGADVRRLITSYTNQAICGTWGSKDRLVDDPKAGLLLAQVEDRIVGLPQGTAREVQYAGEAKQEIASVAQERQGLIADDARALPPIFLVLLIFWLTVLFGSFGYRAPDNGLVVATVVFVAAAVASAIFLLVEMDGAFSGLITVSDLPLRLALASMRMP